MISLMSPFTTAFFFAPFGPASSHAYVVRSTAWSIIWAGIKEPRNNNFEPVWPSSKEIPMAVVSTPDG